MRVQTIAFGIALMMVLPTASAGPDVPSLSQAGAMAFSVVGTGANAASSNDFGGQDAVWQCHKFAPNELSCSGSFTLVGGRSYTPNFNTVTQEAFYTGKLTITITDTDDDPDDSDPQHSRTRVCYSLLGLTGLVGTIPACSEWGDSTLRAGPASVSVSAGSYSYAGGPSVGAWSYWGVLLWQS
jgi:hypothetical protein